MSDERNERAPKRRLELMPEVLPAPRLDGDRGSPRARTVNHMRRMMTTAAAVVGVALGAESRADDAPTPPTPKPTNHGDPGGADEGYGEGEWHMTKDGGPRTAPTSGYGVVDPMPPPSRGCGCHKRGYDD